MTLPAFRQLVQTLRRFGVPPTVAHIVFVVNSFSGQNFSQIENATARVVDSADRDRE